MLSFRFNSKKLHYFGVGLFVQNGKNMFGKNLYGIFFHILWWEFYIGAEHSNRF